MRAIKLQSEYMENPIGIDVMSPILSWKCEEDKYQSAYEIKATKNNKEIWNSGKVDSNKMQAYFEGDLKSREQVLWCVRLWNEKGEQGPWSELASFEMGLLETSDFKAKWINPEGEIDIKKRQPASYLRKTFMISTENLDPNNARLYITCHGIYEASLNGQRVGKFILAPGPGTYEKALFYQTYDVTDLLLEGKNELQVVLGDGWYRSGTGIEGKRNLYGSDIALFCQLEIGGEIVCISDESWKATQDGVIRENDYVQGELVDARFDLEHPYTNWHSVKEVEYGIDNLACSNTVQIEEFETFKSKMISTPNGECVLDFGQNISGYVEMEFEAKEGEIIVLHHGETLDENGNFTIANFQPDDRHTEGGIFQKVTYICKEGRNHYKPKFCTFGFRYVKIQTDFQLDTNNTKFIAHAVYSKMEQTAYFECSDARVNALFHNCVWSQKGNFCDIPTDCPTRERAGWTGDAGIFVNTGLTLMNSYPIFRRWLAECRINQYEDGKIRNIVPRNNKDSMFMTMLSGSVGWGDASIIVPYTMYLRNGDKKILEENYEMMERWMSYMATRTKPETPFLITEGIDYGEWCEPGVDPRQSLATKELKSTGTAYYAYSAELMSEIAAILGRIDTSVTYAEIAHGAKEAYREHFVKDGEIHSDRQCEYVRPIAFNILNESEKAAALRRLNEMIIQNDYHLNTGFLSTQFLCSVLADNGYLDTAYRLLLQDTIPGWLYQVEKGATTVWENWDGIKENGTVQASFNHYSYGVIAGWLVSGICGIKVENQKVTITPQPYSLLEWAEASYDSPMGIIKSSWKKKGDSYKYSFTIPTNVEAEVTLLDGSKMTLGAGVYHN